ncbi:MAG: hypothetical protein ACOY90_07105 [Candidatus Zhuqueibacterota bacterium]
MTNEEALREEQRKMRLLKTLIDLTTAVLYQGNLSVFETIQLIHNTKKAVLKLFPDKEETYNLIYKPRFERILNERLQQN